MMMMKADEDRYVTMKAGSTGSTGSTGLTGLTGSKADYAQPDRVAPNMPT